MTFTNGPPVEGARDPTQDLSGRPLLLAPPWAVFAGLTYSHPLASGITGFVEGEWTLRSGYYGYPDDSIYVRVPGMNIENLQLGLTIDRARIALWVDNILDERTFPTVFPAMTGSGGYGANPGSRALLA